MNKNLDELLRKIVPSLQLKQQRVDAFQTVQNAIQRFLPGSRVVACGSYATGTELQTSDIDITVSLHTTKPHTDVLRNLKQVLTNDVDFNQIAVIPLARVPILTCECKGITIDVSVNNKYAVDTTKWISEHYDVCMKETLILLKYWFVIHRYNNVYTGGLGTYAIALMLYALVQMTTADTKSPISMLKTFFSFWADWHYDRDVLDVGRLQIESKRELGRVVVQQPYLLCIIDPINRENDVTKQAYDVTHIKQSMQHAIKQLRVHGDIGVLLQIHTQNLVHYDSE